MPSCSAGSSSRPLAVYYNGLFEIPNADRLLRTSMTAQVPILVSEAKDALRIPVAALGNKERAGRCMFRVLHGDRPRPRNARIGLASVVSVVGHQARAGMDADVLGLERKFA